MKNRPFENFDFTDFWDDDEYAMNEYIGAPPTEEMIEETERELGYKLPESYIWPVSYTHLDVYKRQGYYG